MSGDAGRQLGLEVEDVAGGQRPVVAPAPQHPPGGAVGQARRDPDPARLPPDPAGDDVGRGAGRGRRQRRAALVGRHAGEDLQRVEAHQGGDQLAGEAARQQPAVVVAGGLERQHEHGGLRRPRRSAGVIAAAVGEEPEGAGEPERQHQQHRCRREPAPAGGRWTRRVLGREATSGAASGARPQRSKAGAEPPLGTVIRSGSSRPSVR